VQDRPIWFGVHFLPSLTPYTIVTLKIRVDLIGMDGHVGLGVSEDDANNCVPDSLFTFLNLVYCGQDILNQDESVL
jgi:hypothetical protein